MIIKSIQFMDTRSGGIEFKHLIFGFAYKPEYSCKIKLWIKLIHTQML